MKRWLLLAVAAVPSPAFADWQYTRWSMTVDEVVAASNAAVHKVKDDKDERVHDLPRLAVGQATEGEATFNVEFYFAKKKLRLIRYSPTGTMDCMGEEAFLLERYGTVDPIETVTEFRNKNLVLLKSKDRAWDLPGGDRLKFNIIRIERPDLPNLKLPPDCVVIIEPASTAAAKS